MQRFHRLRKQVAHFKSRPGEAVGLLLVMGLAATAPFPLGGVQPGGAFRIQLMALLAAGMAASRPGNESPPPRPFLVTAACLLAIGLLGVFQLLPLPAGLVRTLSPASAEVYSGAASIFAASGYEPVPSPRLSIAPTETRAVAILAASTAAAFFAAGSLLVTRTRRRWFAGILLASMAVQAAWAAAADQQAGRVSGPFFNPDHFAGYLGIGLSLAFGFMVAALAGRPRRAGPTHATWLELRIAAGALGIFVWAFFASVLAVTHSRGGMLAAAATMLFLAGLAIGARTHRDRSVRSIQRATLIAGLALGVLFVVAALGSRPLLRFLATDPRDLGEDTRVQIWTHAIDAWKSYPVFGSGLGTFREAFLVVQPRELTGIVEAAHGDFLQLLVTGGLIGACLGVTCWVSLTLFLLRGTLLRIRHEEGAFALAGLGALVTIVLHGLVEFNLSIPATSATMALVVGAAVAALRDADTRAGRGPARTGSETSTIP